MGIRDAFFDWRNRLLADPGFQRRSAAFPLTRPMARASARSLFDLCAGFVYTQVLLACVELDLFEKLRAGPRAESDLIDALGLPEAGARRLLKAAAALDLIEPRSGERYGLGFRGAALLGNPSVFDMIRHHAVLYRDLADPVAVLKDRSRETGLGAYWGYAKGDAPKGLTADDTGPYTRLMAATQGFVAQEVIAAHDFSAHKHLLDVGGGGGAFLAALASAAPNLALGLFDLPAVADAARARLVAAGLADRVTTHSGDFLNDPLPEGYDAVSLVRILHDHDEAPALRLLRNIRAALPKGGALIIAEPMAGAPGAKAMGDAYFGMYLWTMGSGEPRTPDKIAAMLREAGFTDIKRKRTAQPLLTQVMTAL